MLRNLTSLDATAIREITTVFELCKKQGIKVLFSHVNKQPMSVMKKAGFYELAGKDSFTKDIDSALLKAEELTK